MTPTSITMMSSYLRTRLCALRRRPRFCRVKRSLSTRSTETFAAIDAWPNLTSGRKSNLNTLADAAEVWLNKTGGAFLVLPVCCHHPCHALVMPPTPSSSAVQE